MKYKNNYYLTHLLKNCQTLISNANDWIENEDPLLEETLVKIEQGIGDTFALQDS